MWEGDLADEEPVSPAPEVAATAPDLPQPEVDEDPPAEDPLALILRIAGDLEEIRSRETAPSAAELQIRAIRDRIARGAAFTTAYLPEASASI
ncbi:hypothetical protein [Falsigemmobacter faecalis]|uniref:Uncharacterized protein n=1 Tax=Falsigemmobacter faecalis TaxID=2488730 RepID=A0A3P3DQ31_9RHOB|nr:hypothetical protein [Falsigemmobacter faecalis]RRH76367.1 hypothetical protein EG244_06320 [Falsigemmobacter faecalis]